MDLDDVPDYGFREEADFEADKADLGWDEQEFDEHLHAIQFAIGADPFCEPWSVPLAPGSDLRVAVSSATQHRPRAIRVTYRVEGRIIYLMGVSER